MKYILDLLFSKDKINPRSVDAYDELLYKYALKYDNPALDNTIELGIDRLIDNHKELFPGRIPDNKDFIHYKLENSNTIDFLVNYYAKTYMDNGYSPSYALFNVLKLLYDLGESPDAPYLDDLVKSFKEELAVNFFPSEDTKYLPEKYKSAFYSLIKKYFPMSSQEGAQNIDESIESNEDIQDIVSKDDPSGDILPGLMGGVGAAGIGAMSTQNQTADDLRQRKSSDTMMISDSQIAQLLKSAGFSKDSAPTMVAIAIAESGGNAHNIGDIHLMDSKWGPSVGLWQIRSLKSQSDTGGDRDATALFNPSNNAKSAYSISGGGKNFNPWTTWRNGAFKQYMNRAHQAVQSVY